MFIMAQLSVIHRTCNPHQLKHPQAWCKHFQSNPKRPKACIVVKAFSWKESIDYLYTFDPVTRMKSIRMILSIVTSLNWEVHQMDVKSAFLHRDLPEEMNMQQLPRFI